MCCYLALSSVEGDSQRQVGARGPDRPLGITKEATIDYLVCALTGVGCALSGLTAGFWICRDSVAG
jgi:hypothetical protein